SGVWGSTAKAAAPTKAWPSKAHPIVQPSLRTQHKSYSYEPDVYTTGLLVEAGLATARIGPVRHAGTANGSPLHAGRIDPQFRPPSVLPNTSPHTNSVNMSE